MLIQEIEDLFTASAHKATANKTKMTDNDWVGRGVHRSLILHSRVGHGPVLL